jgi:hypothetical protein
VDYSTVGATFQVSTKNSITSEKLFHYGRYRREIIEDAMKRLKGEKGWV